jgi:tetratricopeptide (TPR) repeat protein
VADWRDDMTLFATAALSSPDSAKAHYNLGMLRLKSGDAAGAASSLQRAVEIARGLPERVDMMRDLATALSGMGRDDEALALLERARYIDPSHAGVLVNLGNAYAARGERDKAMEAYEAALRVAPDHSGARMNRARLLLSSGRAGAAAEELERVTRDAPRLPEAWLLLGDARLATGRRDEAAAAWQESIRLAAAGRDDIVRAARERLSRRN